MLYAYRLAQTYLLPVSYLDILEDAPGQNLLELVRCLELLLEREPEFVFQRQGRVLQAVYSCVPFMTEQLNPYAEMLGAVSAVWPVCLAGGVGGRESGRLVYRLEEKQIKVEKYSISGMPFEVMDGMYLQVEFPDSQMAEETLRLLQSARKRTGICVLERSMENYLDGQRIRYYGDGTLFCYICLEGEEGPKWYLEALTIAQKLRLWMAFLEDQIQPREFEWLYQALADNYSYFFPEWSISLEKALEILGFQVVNQRGRFSVNDAKGRPRFFDFEHGGDADRAFLKLLCPLVPVDRITKF
ncbi:MAG: hypothetical protein ACOYBE_08115 [Blautia sp.]|jgi:hypothetical protein